MLTHFPRKYKEKTLRFETDFFFFQHNGNTEIKLFFKWFIKFLKLKKTCIFEKKKIKNNQKWEIQSILKWKQKTSKVQTISVAISHSKNQVFLLKTIKFPIEWKNNPNPKLKTDPLSRPSPTERKNVHYHRWPILPDSSRLTPVKHLNHKSGRSTRKPELFPTGTGTGTGKDCLTRATKANKQLENGYSLQGRSQNFFLGLGGGGGLKKFYVVNFHKFSRARFYLLNFHCQQGQKILVRPKKKRMPTMYCTIRIEIGKQTEWWWRQRKA